MRESKGLGGPAGGGGKSFERPKQNAAVILKRLWKYLARSRWLVLLAILISIASNLLALVGPKLSGYAVDALRPGTGQVDFDAVLYYAKWMLIAYLVSAALSYLLAALMVRIARDVVYRLRRDVFEHLMRLPVRFYDSHAIGDALSVLSYDIDTISTMLSTDLIQMMTNLLTVVGSFFMMLSISPVLFLPFLITIPASILFTRYRARKVRPLYRDRSAALGELNGYAEEMTGGLETIRAYGRGKVFLDRFDEKNVRACTANYRADCFASMTGPSVGFINNLSLALVSTLGAVLYMAGWISLGSVSSFVLYSRKFSGPINEFANLFSELQSTLAAAERVFTLLDEPEEAPDAPDASVLDPAAVRGEVTLTGVDFGYTPDRPVLHGLNLTARPGQTIAVVGPTGAGKTTIINLLMRFYDPNGGTITVDGHDIRTLTRASLRRAYSMVLQDTWLFTGTIYENLAYGKPGVTRQEVMDAARAAHIHRFILSLPNGYDTILQDGGANISKGQRQLLTIARAMLLDAPMLILDEATSNVDTATEQRIQKAMLTLMQGRTCFVIAHRLSTIQNADQILLLQNGCVAEQGTHAELLAKGGAYCALYRAQFEDASAG